MVFCLIELLIINAFRADLSLVIVDLFAVAGMSLGLWFNRQGRLEAAAWFCIITI
jgi:hypothetical protein